MKAEIRLISTLDKVFLDDAPPALLTCAPEGFQNEIISFQAAYRLIDAPGYRDLVHVTCESPLGDRVRVRRVMHVPVVFASFPDADADYLRKTPGLYPDLLRDVAQNPVRAFSDQWQTLWIDVEPSADVEPGLYPVRIALRALDGCLLGEAETPVRVLPGFLPGLDIAYTRWLHCDGIARYYGAEMWSERFWNILERFVRCAARGGMNTILTPIHTPPLDTAQGFERLTCQLVDVTVTGGRYAFGFDRLRRFVDICVRAGIRNFEMAHLFTQWGAERAPKIMATVDGVYGRLFGWDDPACGGAYAAFLGAYLPALTAELRRLGIADRCLFHISDEPSQSQLASYLAAKAVAARYLDGFVVLDAMSDLEIYKTDPTVTPVVATNHIEPFLRENVRGMWAYYCVGQYKDVSNQFMAMPSARTRILGVQLYKFRMAGFLHWSLNFYNSQYSLYPIDPYAVTDGDGFAPAGDMFQLYPGEGGEPEESIRFQVTRMAMDDHRALTRLESLAGRDAVLRLIEADAKEPVTFARYPRDAAYLIELRQKVNRAIVGLTTAR